MSIEQGTIRSKNHEAREVAALKASRNHGKLLALGSLWAVLLAAVLLVPTAFGATPKLTPAAVKGKALYKKNGCGSCHTLTLAASHGTVGPNLNTLKLPTSRIEKQITDGGGFMPSFGGKLTKTQIADIASFVYIGMHSK
jgi:mono/diheme cytochrome c family protein